MLSVYFKTEPGGETEDEKVRVDMLENQAMDFRNGFVMMCYTDLVRFSVNILIHIFVSLC